MTQAITLRTAGAPDVPQIVVLLNAAFAMEWAFIDRDRANAAEIAQYLGTGTFLVVDAGDGSLVSCMYLEQRADRVYLGMLAVSPSQQGRGLGRQMMAAAERHAVSLGCHAVDIRIVNHRTELPPFYRALGFTDNGVESFEDPLLTKPAHFLKMTKRLGRLTVGILIFDDVEVLDFAGPFEVFSRTRIVAGADSRRNDDSAPFTVFTVARALDAITAIGGLKVLPHYSWSDAPAIDILVVPGGFGTRALLDDEATLAWIRATAGRARQVTSVCTGALLLAKVGLLHARRATTHWAGLDLLATIDPTIHIQRKTRVVHDGIFTSAGVSAGIDMSFAVVEHLCGRDVALETAHYIEYPWGKYDVPKHQDPL